MRKLLLAAFWSLSLSALLAVGSSAQDSPEVTTVSQRGGALAEIMTAIERDSFYQLSEKELNDVSECIAARAFTSFEIKKDVLKEDFKVPSCFPQDKRAMYFSPEMAKSMAIEREGHFGGIGIKTGIDKDTGGLLIKDILPGNPVQKDGRLKVGDVIISAGDFVEGKETKMVPLKGFNIGRIIEIIRGVPGTKIALEVLRKGQKLPLIVITREDVKIQNIKSSEIEPGIGYLKISSFMNENIAENFLDAAMDLEQKGVKKLVIDLRQNGGGLMYATIGIASLFAPQKGNLILEVRWRGQKVGQGQRYQAKEIGPFSGWKVVVLIDGSSASASEILAGSLKIWGAKIVGLKSYGKGSVQVAVPLSDGGAFNFTTGIYYLADGKTPEDGAIEPHFVVEDDPKTPEIDEALAIAIGILTDPK